MTEDSQSPKYCIECGSELPDSGKFCPECGEKIGDTDRDSNDGAEDNEGTVKHDEYDSREIDDELYRRAEKLAEDAEGGIIPEMLIRTKKPHLVMEGVRSEGQWMLYDRTLISFLEEDEQPQHLLFNSLSGIKILDPDDMSLLDAVTVRNSGTEPETPHRDGGRFTFLMPTNRRLLYIAAHDGEDDYMEFDYSNIKSAKMKVGMVTDDILEFVTTDGCKYKYSHGSMSPTNVFSQSAAANYIDDMAEGEMGAVEWAKSELKTEQKDTFSF